MQAIILAGGFGTRLQSMVSDVPKPMAPVAGKPFLAWLFENLESQGVTEALLCVHHLHGNIREHFGRRFGALALDYVIEKTPLGTGGALRFALKHLDPKEPVFALNGDSMVKLNCRRMMEKHLAQNSRMSMAVWNVDDCSRYSALTIKNGHVAAFELLGKAGQGAISAGFYAVSPHLFEGFDLPEAFSLERDFLAPYAPALQPAAYDGVHYFIDIGIPKDYQVAQTSIPGRSGAAA